MKHQYVGDVNDYRKYGVLRSLGSADWPLGICWMVTQDDGSPDGRKTDYLVHHQNWRHFDPELFDHLAKLVQIPEGRSLQSVESPILFPRATFFAEAVPNSKDKRLAWFDRAMQRLTGLGLLFFDPDNGLEVRSTRMGHKNSSKFLYLAEVGEAWQTGCSVLIYQHFARVRRDPFIRQKMGQLRDALAHATVIPIVTSHVLFLLAIQPHH